MSITPGENIGPYRVIEQLGSGGMATVFKAYHPALDRYVAIKILHPAFKADPQFFERFKREARIVANLEHPSIIPVYDFNEHKGEPYLVMRYVEGDTLKPGMEGQPMPPDQILHLMRPVCQALSYAHKRGVLHRDIKPSNIMVTTDGNVFLTDFGLARMVQAGESTLSQDMMLGTPQYISPEQAQGAGELDGRTDIYSLGVVLFEMLTGRVPFNADTPFATVHDHIYAPLPLPSTINPDIDPAVERMLLKALAKEPDDRYATADELLKSMEATLGPQFNSASQAVVAPEADSQRSAMPWWVWAGGAGIVLLLLVGLLAGALLLRRANRNIEPTTDNQAAPAQVVDSDIPSDQPSDLPTDSAPDQSDAVNAQESPQLTRQAATALREGQLDQAADLFNQAIEADPHHLPAYLGLSQALRQSGDEAGSLATLEEAAANNPADPLALGMLGEAQLVNDNPEAALEAFEQAAQLAPDKPVPYAGQAVALLEMDRMAEAKAALDTGLALDPSNPLIKLANAIYLHKDGKRLQAVRELEQLARSGPSDFIKERARTILASVRD